jgi:hypothetical protein
MILNIMGLLGVPKLQNMYTLAQRKCGNVYVNVVGTPGTFVGTFMGSCLETWERCRVERGPLWESTGLLAATRFACRTVESSCLQKSRSSISSKLQPLSRWPIMLQLQNTTLNVMDKSSVCTLNMLEVKPFRTKCVRAFIFVPNI